MCVRACVRARACVCVCVCEKFCTGVGWCECQLPSVRHSIQEIKHNDKFGGRVWCDPKGIC